MTLQCYSVSGKFLAQELPALETTDFVLNTPIDFSSMNESNFFLNQHKPSASLTSHGYELDS